MTAHDLSEAERARVAPYVTDPVGPVFALTGLPEVVKGALFARYSRSPKSLRRLLLDEFLPDSPVAQEAAPRVGEARAEALYDRVLAEYGDDSVAQLGGAHVAVEGASNLLTKVLQWGRLASYLEQSTRYIAFTDRPGGAYRYHRPATVMAQPELGRSYTRTLDGAFDAYSATCCPDGRARRPRGARGSGDGARRARARGAGARPRPPAGPAAGRDDRQRRDLRLGPGVRGHARAHGRPPAARGPRVRRPHADRAAQGDPGVPHPGGPGGPGRRPRALPARVRARGRRDRRPPAALARRGPGRAAGAAGRLRPRRRGAGARPRALARRGRRPGRGPVAGRRARRRASARGRSPPGRATAPTAASARAARSRRRRTPSRSCATTGRTATSSATAC